MTGGRRAARHGSHGSHGSHGTLGSLGDWAELLRVSAVFTVPGDALAGAAAAGRSPNRGTGLAAGASLCLYEAGMALNDWSDRHIDAVERPGRPLPSGRIAPPAALAASAALTAAGLRLAASAGPPALLTAAALAGTVWAYDLRLKHTAFGPAAMATARALDLLLGATATATASRSTRSSRWADRALVPERSPAPVARPAPAAVGSALLRRGAGRAAASSAAVPARDHGVPLAGRVPRNRPVPGRLTPAARAVGAAALLGAHTFTVTAVSRRETLGASSAVPLAALGAVAAVGYGTGGAQPPVVAVLAAAYAATAARTLTPAALNPSPPLLQRAVGGGIRATIPLQAALTARAGRPVLAVSLLALLPLARRLSRKVSPT